MTGDLNRFFACDPEAGIFMAGWYFVMMFGLPAAAYAMYRQANRDERKATGAVMGSSGFTSFLTGITEPIEFSFLFLAPALYAIHALLSGSALVVADLLGIKHGFGFSAGLIDYLVSLPQTTNPLLIWPVGLVYGVIYFGLFTVAIRALDLATPGREPRRQAEEATAPTARPAQA
ncbi:MAG: PTS transporter subunit EIIC [Actinomycetota bacterium]|nr:PTS transporter subunit EIIC [Actinomycetota bacterium]